MARRLLFGVVLLVTLIALAYGVENWRGKRAWNQFQRAAEAQGEKLDWQAIVPPPVPDDQNFAMAPILKPLLDYTPGPAVWHDPEGKARLDRVEATAGAAPGRSAPRANFLEKGEQVDLAAWQAFYRGNANYPQAASPQSAAADVLLALSKFDPEIRELRQAAAERPAARFPLRYEDNYACLLPHLAVLKKLALVVQLRAIARLESGDAAQALEEIKLGFRLADAIQAEPLLISHLVRIAIQAIMLQSVHHGLAGHHWSDDQLAALQSYLAGVNLLPECERGLRGERAFSIAAVELLRSAQLPANALDPGGNYGLIRFAPDGWFLQNKVSLGRMYQDYLLNKIDSQTPRVAPRDFEATERAIANMRWGPYNFFVGLLFPAVSKAVMKSAHAQTLVNQAMTACALERHRLSTGRFPDSLEALVPRFLDRLPADVINRQPLKYRRTDDGRFILYSVGWNEVDDGGVASWDAKQSAHADRHQGDWVWRSAAPK